MKCSNFARRQQASSAINQQVTQTANQIAQQAMDTWLQVAVACARADNSSTPEVVINWADTIAEAHAARLGAIMKELAK